MRTTDCPDQVNCGGIDFNFVPACNDKVADAGVVKGCKMSSSLDPSRNLKYGLDNKNKLEDLRRWI